MLFYLSEENLLAGIHLELHPLVQFLLNLLADQTQCVCILHAELFFGLEGLLNFFLVGLLLSTPEMVKDSFLVLLCKSAKFVNRFHISFS